LKVNVINIYQIETGKTITDGKILYLK